MQREHQPYSLFAIRYSLAFSLCLAAGTAFAQSAVEEFYRGRQINLIVGYGPGGGYDITARLLARYLGRYIPGNPNIVVQNMAGAGSMRAANYLYVSAPRDGSTVGVVLNSLYTVRAFLPHLGALQYWQKHGNSGFARWIAAL